MQTNTITESRSSSRHLFATAGLAMPQGAFETRHHAGREVSVVDGLMSVAQRGWRLGVGIGDLHGGAVATQ